MSASTKEYVTAVLAAARQPLKLRDELTALAEVVTGTPRVKQILLDASLESEKSQARIVDRLFPKASPLSRNLLTILVSDRQVDRLPELARAYARAAATAANVIDVTIESAYPLSPADQARIAKGLPLAGRRPLITAVVNRDLIGGVRATIEGATYDASVLGHLEALAEEITV